MQLLPKEIMILTIDFLDYLDLSRLYQCNKLWLEILSDEQTWKRLLLLHFGTQKLAVKSAWETYTIYYFSNGNTCYFCSFPTEEILCEKCFSKSWIEAVNHYGTNDVQIMSVMASDGHEGDALTFKFSSQEHEKNQNIADAEFIIGNWEFITEICKYDRLPLYSRKWIDLSTGNLCEFWQQAGL